MILTYYEVFDEQSNYDFTEYLQMAGQIRVYNRIERMLYRMKLIFSYRALPKGDLSLSSSNQSLFSL